jgi:uncharacterized protein YdcH (DUF465 family)
MTNPSERATFGSLVATHGALVDRIQQRLNSREPVWYPEIVFLVKLIQVLVLAVRADQARRAALPMARQRLDDQVSALEAAADRATKIRESK